MELHWHDDWNAYGDTIMEVLNQAEVPLESMERLARITADPVGPGMHLRRILEMDDPIVVAFLVLVALNESRKQRNEVILGLLDKTTGNNNARVALAWDESWDENAGTINDAFCLTQTDIVNLFDTMRSFAPESGISTSVPFARKMIENGLRPKIAAALVALGIEQLATRSGADGGVGMPGKN